MYKHVLSSRRRGGFTMVELMVVIAIVGVLVALGVGAGYRVLSGMRISATENAMRTIQKVLNEQWEQVIKDANNEEPTPLVKNMAGGDPARARVLWIKMRLAEAFPQSYAEIKKIVDGGGVYGTQFIVNKKYIATYYGLLHDAKVNIQLNAPPGPTESSACLLMALRVSRGRVKLDEANLAGFIADTNGDGMPELVDNWGNPLHFQRFFITAPPPGAPPAFQQSTVLAIQSELAQLNPRFNTQRDILGDPIDPEGLLQQADASRAWSINPASANANTFASILYGTPASMFPATKLPTGRTTQQPYYVPFVWSTGPTDPTDANPNNPNSYIYSYRLKVGSQ
jgi:prepilin-type N-terminal cleavage/methylation domain-containing protein